MLLQQFQEFIAQKKLIKTSDKLLLAVSGGVDSMVLLHLCLKAGYDFSVAHVNFKLRGADANADEALVTSTCKAHQIECFSTQVETQDYANQHKLSPPERSFQTTLFRFVFSNCIVTLLHWHIGTL